MRSVLSVFKVTPLQGPPQCGIIIYYLFGEKNFLKTETYLLKAIMVKNVMFSII